MPKLLSDLPEGFVQIPQGIEGASEWADNSFLIDFGIVDHNGLETGYFSCGARNFVNEPDGRGFEVQLIQVPDTLFS